jgi:hypothetical protein
MLNFAEYFLLEMAAASSSEASDDKGKLHELLLAKHLNPTKDKNGENVLPEHHRAKSDIYGDETEGGTPEQVHNKLKGRMAPAAYEEINAHAKQTAEEVLKHLEKNGFDKNHISSVHWTSNRDTSKKSGDHEKTTGIRDPNANADLIMSYTHPQTGEVRHVGVSAKYGTESQPNYRNDGLAALEQKSGLDKGSLTDIQKNLDKHMADNLGYTGTKLERHVQYKVGRKLKGEERENWKKQGGSNKDFQPVSLEARRARQAEDASVEARQQMARRMDEGFGKMTDEQLRNFIRQQVSPPTKIYHVVAHSHVQDDGSAISKVGDMDKIADEHLNNFQNLRVRKGKGIYVQIVGDQNGKERPVAQQILKTGSGPVKGSAGAFKLNPLPKGKVAKIDNSQLNQPVEQSKPKKPRSLQINTSNIEPVEQPEQQKQKAPPKPIQTNTVGGLPWKK